MPRRPISDSGQQYRTISVRVTEELYLALDARRREEQRRRGTKVTLGETLVALARAADACGSRCADLLITEAEYAEREAYKKSLAF